MIRAVFLADTHLGFDWPLRPRIERRRRGDDFFTNYLAVLAYAAKSRADFVLHGGDVFFRSRVSDAVVARVFEPLLDIADAGIDVFIVPGNHERSRIPRSLFADHPRVHIFDRPKSFVLERRGFTAELSGFPFVGRSIRSDFPRMCRALAATWKTENPDARLMCLHEIFEGARVGPSGYQFRSAADVIRCQDLPADYDGFLSGHIHRAQVLTEDPSGSPLPAPVVYPGSVERTSHAEQEETKGFFELTIGRGLRHSWHPLPTRPMVTIRIDANFLRNTSDAVTELRRRLAEIDPSSVVRVRVERNVPAQVINTLTAETLRKIAPPTMNISLSIRRDTSHARGKSP